MTRTSMVLGLLIGLTFTSASMARDLFVNNRIGDDHRPGTSDKVTGEDGPVRTIKRALELARGTDRIIVVKTAEPYRESISVQAGRHSGRPGEPFTIVSNGAVLDGRREVPINAWAYVKDGVYRYRPPGLTRQILYLDGKPARRVKVEDRKIPELEPLQWYWLKGYIYFRPDKGKVPSDHALSHTFLPVGITMYECRHVVISGLVVQGYELDGVNAHDSVFDGVLNNVTIRGNARSGISIGGASRVKITGCLVGNNGEAQVRTEGFSTTEILQSDIIGNTAPRIVREGGKVIENKDGKPAARVGDTPRNVFLR